MYTTRVVSNTMHRFRVVSNTMFRFRTVSNTNQRNKALNVNHDQPVGGKTRCEDGRSTGCKFYGTHSTVSPHPCTRSTMGPLSKKSAFSSDTHSWRPLSKQSTFSTDTHTHGDHCQNRQHSVLTHTHGDHCQNTSHRHITSEQHLCKTDPMPKLIYLFSSSYFILLSHTLTVIFFCCL